MTVKKYIKGLNDEKDRYDRMKERFQKKNRNRKQSKRLRPEHYYEYDENDEY